MTSEPPSRGIPIRWLLLGTNAIVLALPLLAFFGLQIYDTYLLRQTERPKETEERVIAQLRRMFEQVPDLNTRVTRPVLFSSKKPVVVQINGEDLPELKRFSDEAVQLLAGR